MPVYVYETIPEAKGEPSRVFEVKQSMKEPALIHDPESGLPVRRVIQGGHLFSRSSSDSCCANGGCEPTCSST